MVTVKIAQLKDHLSYHLRAVEQGGEVLVTDRGRPIARIVPLAPIGQRVRFIPPTRDFVAVRDRPRVPAGWPTSSTDLLAEERREGRQ